MDNNEFNSTFLIEFKNKLAPKQSQKPRKMHYNYLHDISNLYWVAKRNVYCFIKLKANTVLFLLNMYIIVVHVSREFNANKYISATSPFEYLEQAIKSILINQYPYQSEFFIYINTNIYACIQIYSLI